MAKRPPNIFIFMSDQEQAQVVKKGHPCITPVAEQLAEEGVLFERCYTPAAHSCPARASFWTGLYPSHHGVFNNVCNPPKIHGTFDPSCKTFGENLRAAGWNLGHTGKWHISDTENPSDRGWEEVESTATKDARMGLTWEEWCEQSKKGMSDGPRERGEIVMPGWGRRPMYGSHDRPMESGGDYKVVSRAIEAMERYVKEDKPFCIYCGPTGPHDPYIIPGKYAEMYDATKVELPASFQDDLSDKPRVYQRHRRDIWSQLTDDEVKESIAHYWGYCTLVDDYRKMVVEAIDALGIRDNTVLMGTSDHGDYGAAHGLYCKGVPSFDEAYRVPLIVRWPEGIEDPGRVVDEFVTLCDFAPTVQDLAGVDLDPTSGASFVPFFEKSEVDGWTQEFHTQFNGVELYYSQRICQTKEHKYVFNGFDFDELYDLTTDPHEMKNLADDPNYEDVKLDLVKRMWRFAHRERDIISNKYWTVALVPWGPMVALGEE